MRLRQIRVVNICVIFIGTLLLAVIAGSTRLIPFDLGYGREPPDTTPALNIDLNHFPQESVLDNPECRMTVHSGAEGGTALIVLPSLDGARFATLDANGLLNKGRLPFRPQWFGVARRGDGSVLTAFRDITYVLLDDGSTKRRGFARVNLDGQSILTHDMVWDLEVAPDGSSYYFVEPVQGETSQMVIHNLDLDIRRTYFLGTLYYAPPSSHGYYSSHYSQDRSEIMFFPDYEGVGEHRFLPTDNSRDDWRVIDVSNIDHLVGAAFTSSEAGFFVTFNQKHEGARLFRRDFDWQGTQWRMLERWSIPLPESAMFTYPIQFSQDGSMLLIRGEEILLIDTDSGEVRFRFPARDKQAQLSRLAHLHGPEATEADIGTVRGAMFRGDQLWISRAFEGPKGWIDARRVWDVFELKDIAVDAGPNYRVDDEPSWACASARVGEPGLEVVGGRLVYR